MIKRRDLEKLSYAELVELRAEVDEMIVAAKATQKQQLKAQLEALAAEAGLSLDEVLGRSGGGKGRKGAKGNGAAKYRNPADPSQTWTGRGRKPNWLVEALEEGRSMDEFAV